MNRKYDYVIIGSGFGGSVSALRLAEKGYQVAVIEQG
ncbi:MAG: FAD-binding protein, partial [Candidatus Marinimicrobia bacterium]|nr:FAD-binding protein [Candidatus Neomarinimicrobiota bacterium]